MLLPDKHISLAESLLGLGALILGQLDDPGSMDDIHHRISQVNETKELPAFHDYESVALAVLFLYMIGAVEMTDTGDVRRCAS